MKTLFGLNRRQFLYTAAVGAAGISLEENFAIAASHLDFYATAYYSNKRGKEDGYQE